VPTNQLIKVPRTNASNKTYFCTSRNHLLELANLTMIGCNTWRIVIVKSFQAPSSNTNQAAHHESIASTKLCVLLLIPALWLLLLLRSGQSSLATRRFWTLAYWTALAPSWAPEGAAPGHSRPLWDLPLQGGAAPLTE
jgi:hypothetical protein